MIDFKEDRYRLTIPLGDAVYFALGLSDLSYPEPSDELRQLVGLLALDLLEYTEQWRTAGILRNCMQAKWPGLFE
ncbi:MAG TPA: hypothetical protein VM940_02670 [Chthoniobacterales bacterium]|jgi:hypothetical protein|nr:hypothetical protein [Chthoniobacterales bacterium]